VGFSCIFVWYDYVFVIGENGVFFVLPVVLNFPAIATTTATRKPAF